MLFSAPGKVILHGEHSVVYGKVVVEFIIYFNVCIAKKCYMFVMDSNFDNIASQQT